MLTVRAVADSIRTVLAQRDGNAAILSPNGFNPLREYPQIARIDGYWALFQQKAVENAATYLRKPHSVKLDTDGPIGSCICQPPTASDKTHRRKPISSSTHTTRNYFSCSKRPAYGLRLRSGSARWFTSLSTPRSVLNSR